MKKKGNSDTRQNFSRREFLHKSGAAMLGTSLVSGIGWAKSPDARKKPNNASKNGKNQKMNILWIMVDQMRGDCAGYMNHPIVQTPQLDRLAARSVVFEKAFVQAPLCAPSRTCHFTGRYVHEHGVWWNGIHFTRSKQHLLPELLQKAGYHTSLIGKLHFSPPQNDFGFDHKLLHEEVLLNGTDLNVYEKFLKSQNPPAKGASASTVWSIRKAGVGICHMPEELEETRWVADRTCDFLKKQQSAPFFLYTSFIRPHTPYNPLPRYAEL